MTSAFPLLMFSLLLATNKESYSEKLTRMPELLESVQADYPPEAQAAGISGEVVLLIDISATGKVTAAQVKSSPGHGLDKAALAAARRLRFKPAEIHGHAFPVRIEYRFTFVMKPAKKLESFRSTAYFHGTVIERGSKKPLAGAIVDVNNGAFSTVTDSTGNFELSNLPAGNFKVVVLENNHQRFETHENFQEKKRTQATYYLLQTFRDTYTTTIIGKKDRKDSSIITIQKQEAYRISGGSGDLVRVLPILTPKANENFLILQANIKSFCRTMTNLIT